MAVQGKNQRLWEFWEANDVKPMQRFFFLMLVIAGFISIGLFFDWWFRTSHIASLPLFILLSFIV